MRRGRDLAIAVMAALFVLSAMASTAGAEVTHAGGIAYVEKSYPHEDHGHGRFHANCPNGTHVLGGGAKIFTSFGGASTQHSYPIDGKDADKKPDDGWEVAAFIGLDDEDWTAYA